MEILEIRTLRGPNYWSGYWKKLIIMRLDIGAYEKKPSQKIKGFYDRMVEVMPTLENHGCSYGEPGGFLKRVVEGTWAGHIIEHFALELQTLAGMDTGYGRTRETGEREFITSSSVITKKRLEGMRRRRRYDSILRWLRTSRLTR
jgi:cyanophycin synthetase